MNPDLICVFCTGDYARFLVSYWTTDLPYDDQNDDLKFHECRPACTDCKNQLQRDSDNDDDRITITKISELT